MTFNIKQFIIFIYFFVNIPVMSMDTPPIKIGVEIETSSIKTNIGGNNLGFIIYKTDTPAASSREFNSRRLKRTPLWVIENDTSDESLKKVGLDSFDSNLEVRTIGGFDDKEFFLQKLKTMTEVILRLYNESLGNSFEINLKALGDIVSSIEKSEDLFIDYKDEDVRYFEIKSIPNKKVVRPQITYQLSLNKIPDLFKRLETIGDETIKDFCASLEGNNFKKYEFSGYKDPSFWGEEMLEDKKMAQNAKNRNEILNYFNENFLQEIKNCSKNVKGFSYLFLYYWRNIFNSNTFEGGEPGPKQFLSIMSRTSFSQIYDNNLSEDEKKEFKKIFDRHIAEHGEQYLIREYPTSGKEKLDGKRLTLADWYYSIVSKENRVRKRKISTNDNFVFDLVDKLSPPPGLPDNYSMGLIHIDSTKSPLIEGRSYARMTFHGKEIGIDNVKDFISEEADWFFKEIK